MALAFVLSASLIGVRAQAEESEQRESAAATVRDRGIGIVNGTDVPAGKWPDTAAVLFNNEQGCTGTLIAPRWVVTAAHCLSSDLNAVLLGVHTLARPEDGEYIRVIRQIVYPNPNRSYDIGLLQLEAASTIAPRTIASGWARFDIRDGAQASFVGYGAVDYNGRDYVWELQEAVVPITDADCTSTSGCEPNVSPGGELTAGGDGTDSCLGDSGGPIYLHTDAGDFLAGATSRGTVFDPPCYYGGIYVRTDALISWFEEQMGEALPVGPMPYSDILVAEAGRVGEATVVHNDHKPGAAHVFAIETQGLHGVATVDAAGVVSYEADAEHLGPDSVQVRVTDASDPGRTLVFTMDVDVIEPAPEGCGCQSGSSGTALPILLAAMALLWRRRRDV